MRVPIGTKCPPDGELAVGRTVKHSLAVQSPHPVATYSGRRIVELPPFM